MIPKFARDVSTTLVTRALGFVLGFLTSILIARALGPTGKGLYATVLAVVDLATALASLGVGKAIIYYLGRGTLNHSRLAGAVGALVVVNGSLAILVTAVGMSLVHSQVLEGVGSSAYLLALPLAFVGVLFNYTAGLLRGEQRIFDCNRATITRSVVFLVGAGSLSLVGLNPQMALLALLFASLFASGVLLFFLYRASLLVWPIFDFVAIRALVSYGVIYQIYSILMLLHYRFDLFLVGHFADAASVGYYSIATNVAQLVWNVPTAVTFVLLPWVANQADGNAKRGTSKVSRHVLALMVLLSGGLCILAKPLVRLAYGVEYLPAVAPLRALLLGIVMNGLVLVLGGHLIGEGRLLSLILIAATGLSANIALNVWWLPVYGVVGAAWASSVTYSIVGMLALFLFLRDEKTGTRAIDVIILKRSDIEYVLQAVRQGVSFRMTKGK